MNLGDWKKASTSIVSSKQSSPNGASSVWLVINVSPLVTPDGSDADCNDAGGGEGGDMASRPENDIVASAAAAAATRWMDLGDIMASGTWKGGEAGKLRLAELPFKQSTAAS